MSQVSVKDYLAQAAALARTTLERTIPYVLGGMTLSGMDCQGLCEYLLVRCGIPRRECNLAGSNAHYRACLWTGTPEECRQRYGRIPAGAWLFIVKNDGKEPAKYQGDGIGNASHMGVYLGAKEGALHASSSRGSVTIGSFNGTSGSGGWNRVGLCQWVDYGVTADSQSGGTDWEQSTGEEQPEGTFSDLAQVSTPDGNPVKLRALPSRKCSLYWKVPNGASVQVEGLVDADGTTWAKARYGSQKGYIMSAFIIGG
ncbi:MAG: hypothetical protein IKC28_01240 [Clostridia bacterium]|nr:hypothetical protein [Clostridia bacterium]